MQTQQFQENIDQIVYELYGLSEEEVGINKETVIKN